MDEWMDRQMSDEMGSIVLCRVRMHQVRRLLLCEMDIGIPSSWSK